MGSQQPIAEVDSSESPPQHSLKTLICTLVWAAMITAVLLGLGFGLHGKTGIEKVLTRMAMPVGVTWLLIGGWFIEQCRAKRWRAAGVAGTAWAMMTVVTTPPLATWLTMRLEGDIPPFDASSEQPLDVLFVLGGGTSDGPYRAQVARAGDRVIYAAELYHQGHVQRLVTTGSAVQSMAGNDRRGPADQTIEIWTGLGIPADAIGRLSGNNTSEEMKSIRTLVDSELGDARIGVLTSASHLPRAMRLAKAAGLERIVPVPADYRWSRTERTMMDYLPNAEILANLARIQHELLARLVGR